MAGTGDSGHVESTPARLVRRGAVVVILAAVAASGAGCQTNKPPETTSSADATKAHAQLQSLPSLTETKSQVDQAMVAVTAAASGLIPGLKWDSRKAAETACIAPYDQTGGHDLALPTQFAADAGMTDDVWAALQDAAKDAAAKVGATDVRVLYDEPNNREVWFTGTAGIAIKVGYTGNLSVSGETGCRL